MGGSNISDCFICNTNSQFHFRGSGCLNNQAKKDASIAFLRITLILLVLTISYNTEANFAYAQIELNVSPAQTHSGNTNTTNTSIRYSNLVIPSSSVSSYPDTTGDFWIVGQVKNNFTFPITSMQINATVYDSSHIVVSTAYSFPDIDVLRPGEKSGFEILLHNVLPFEFNSYALSASYQKASTSKPASLTVDLHRHYFDGNSYHILGEVINEGKKTATNVKVSAVFFDVNHEIIDSSSYPGDTSPSNIPPIRKAPFDLVSLSPNATKIKFASVNVQSDQYSLMNNQSAYPVSSNVPLASNSTTPLPSPNQSNTTLQIRSDTDWSGTYGDNTGSTTIDGHGNKDITLLSCSNTYSALFQKKGQGQGFLTLNIIQNVTNNAKANAGNFTQYPQITNTQSTTAQFGTVSVSGSC